MQNQQLVEPRHDFGWNHSLWPTTRSKTNWRLQFITALNLRNIGLRVSQSFWFGHCRAGNIFLNSNSVENFFISTLRLVYGTCPALSLPKANGVYCTESSESSSGSAKFVATQFWMWDETATLALQNHYFLVSSWPTVDYGVLCACCITTSTHLFTLPLLATATAHLSYLFPSSCTFHPGTNSFDFLTTRTRLEPHLLLYDVYQISLLILNYSQ